MSGVDIFKFWALSAGLLVSELSSSSEAFLFHSSNKTTASPANRASPSTSSHGLEQENQDEQDIQDPVKAEAGTIAGVVFAILICASIISAVGIIYLKRKRARDAEYRRQALVHQTSSQSAGVYMDTTTDTQSYRPTAHGAAPKKKYTSMRKNPDMFEDDSEDELWSSEVR